MHAPAHGQVGSYTETPSDAMACTGVGVQSGRADQRRGYSRGTYPGEYQVAVTDEGEWYAGRTAGR
jgi:hypothetical protein